MIANLVLVFWIGDASTVLNQNNPVYMVQKPGISQIGETLVGGNTPIPAYEIFRSALHGAKKSGQCPDTWFVLLLLRKAATISESSVTRYAADALALQPSIKSYAKENHAPGLR
jgi:hypothetical protein